MDDQDDRALKELEALLEEMDISLVANDAGGQDG